MKKIFRIVIGCIVILYSVACLSQDSLISSTIPFQKKGFIDFNGYYDTRNVSTLTLNLFSAISPRFQYFSLSNFNSDSLNTSDLGNYYGEHNVRFKVKSTSPIDLTLQYVVRSNPSNDDWKIGSRVRVNDVSIFKSFFERLHMSFSINPMLVQFREHINTKFFTQIEYVYFIHLFPSVFSKRLYLNGFADQNFISNKTKWVTEHQIGYRFYSDFYLVTEFRVNQFATKSLGLGYGLQYKINF